MRTRLRAKHERIVGEESTCRSTLRPDNAQHAAASSSISGLMQVSKSMRAEVLPLSVSSLEIRQVKSLRIGLLRDAPRSALPTSIKSMTTGVALKVLAALASGDSDRNAPGSSPP